MFNDFFLQRMGVGSKSMRDARTCIRWMVSTDAWEKAYHEIRRGVLVAAASLGSNARLAWVFLCLCVCFFALLCQRTG